MISVFPLVVEPLGDVQASIGCLLAQSPQLGLDGILGLDILGLSIWCCYRMSKSLNLS